MESFSVHISPAKDMFYFKEATVMLQFVKKKSLKCSLHNFFRKAMPH